MKKLPILKCLKQLATAILLVTLTTSNLEAQTKKLKRPKSKVRISSVDNFVQKSFNIYDKVYKYDGYAASGTSLDDEDIDVLEEAIEDGTTISDSAPAILKDIDGASVFKQAKATLQINKAKNALRYSIETSKELLVGHRENKNKEDKEDSELSSNSDKDTNSNSGNSSNSDDEGSKTEDAASNVSNGLEIYSKFDFVPGDELLFFDDFSQDFIGDLPSKWNTNGSGAVVKLNNVEGHWYELKSGQGLFVMPNINNLPEDYTIEFDLLTAGLSSKTASSAKFTIILSDTDLFKNGKSYVSVSLPLVQNREYSMRVHSYFEGKKGKIDTRTPVNISQELNNQPHIAISVTKHRYRLWINEVKHVDIPRFIEKLDVLNYLKFNLNSLNEDEHLMIKNLKILKGGEDLRRQLISKGKISTNGILFDSGSANIQPQSLGIVRQISQVLMQDESIKLNIIGHTDADGSDVTNLELSKARAAAVKEALVSIYKISESRLTTDGKGETQPVGDNNTAEGKSKNRRVEFVKI
ncbi:OmpA family protein [Winogradskyella sp. F6397]|uniref:OmpA family protein n=1 Tax=Winogradskyella marina TaxID=2785530 RepID=A0ABS0EI24_9FLAO|nr:OmpA family protein [Winogradskyella marina]MBF8150110.1 OmpA family protein [Winogradskyella marina]